MERNPWIAIAGISLGQRGHIPPPPRPPAPGPFSMASAKRLDGLLRRAGFAEVHIEEICGKFTIADADDYLGLIGDTAGPVGLALQGLGDRDRAEVRGDVEDALRRFVVDSGGHELPCMALCAVAS
jgi:hypothetical protein